MEAGVQTRPFQSRYGIPEVGEIAGMMPTVMSTQDHSRLSLSAV
jgi:hypothetical protein